jgi:hypothetical protein
MYSRMLLRYHPTNHPTTLLKQPAVAMVVVVVVERTLCHSIRVGSRSIRSSCLMLRSERSKPTPRLMYASTYDKRYASNPTQHNPTQPNPTQPNPTQPNPIQSNPIQSNPIQSNPIQPNPTQPNPINNLLNNNLNHLDNPSTNTTPCGDGDD